MSEKAVNNSTRTKVWDGVLFLLIYMTIISLIAALFDSGDYSLQKGIGITAIASIIIYVIIVRRFHLNIKKKTTLLMFLLIMTSIGGFSLGRYFYWTSPSMPEVKRVIDGIAQLKLKANLREIIKLRQADRELTESIKIKPQNIEQGKEYIDVIYQLFSVHKKSYELEKHFHEQILALISSVKNDQDRIKVEAVLRDKGHLDINELIIFRKQHDKCYEALTASLNARKEYYDSFVKEEPKQTQDYLWHKWLTFEDAYKQEESKLNQISVWNWHGPE